MKAIMYHYIRKGSKDFPFFYFLSFDDFRKQLDYFQKEFGFLSYTDIKEIFVKKNKEAYNANKGKIILTFDDGLKDHYRYVYPELLSRGLTGIFYIPTAIWRGKMLDVHKIHYLLGKFGGKKLLELTKTKIQKHMLEENYCFFQKKTYIGQNNDQYTNSFKKLFNYFIKYKYREYILDEIANKLLGGGGIKSMIQNFYITLEEAKEMAQNQMLFGSHSVNHCVFSKLDATSQIREIQDSFSLLEFFSSSQGMKTFCYPYGGFHSFTKDTEKILSKNGCHFAFNVEPRDVLLEDILNRPLAIPRYDCNLFNYGKASCGMV